jgi:pimeloyl-ACP methyl ester carboxylesterase
MLSFGYGKRPQPGKNTSGAAYWETREDARVSRIKSRRRAGKIAAVAGASVAALAVSAVAGVVYMARYENPAGKALAEAGIAEKTTQVGDVKFNYAEGPGNGRPPLLLLHAQTLDWYAYSKVLPGLSANFHVFAVDCPGHGKTECPEGYPMTAGQIGGDLAGFIENVIGDSAFVTGNSSGGLLAVWLAANRPDLVRAIVLEDPPLFSSEYPAVKETVAYRLFAASENAVNDPGYGGNFLDYWVENGKEFFRTYAGPFAQPLVKFAVGLRRSANPGAPMEIAFVPATVQEMLRGLDYYDPSFGAAFYDGAWNAGFPHEEALRKIRCPAVLIQADFSIKEDGTLDGAMSREQAELAVSSIPDCRYVRVKAGHVTHLEAPGGFIGILEEHFLGG